MTILRFRVSPACILAASCFLAIEGSANAANIFANAITDPNPSAANPFTLGQTFDSNISVSGIGGGPTIVPNPGSNRYAANSWSLANLDSGDYFTWTLTPNSGYEIDFNSLSGSWQRSATGPQQYSLRSSLDNFASEIASGEVTGNAVPVAYSLNLSALQDVTSPIEFRLFAWGGSANAGTFSIVDFAFDGSVAAVSVPEPASLALVLTAACVCGFFRRCTVEPPLPVPIGSRKGNHCLAVRNADCMKDARSSGCREKEARTDELREKRGSEQLPLTGDVFIGRRFRYDTLPVAG